ncbi:hypothetical protein DJ013_12205 [Arcticibacterium luteifluviistationis]|uniref:DUF4157 domain-containing protein n=1 Tax=Arcticibacterium luteifluviistationis TaxID=1784714 RepID=A0A2Z4GCM9_9BACT|nr:hypothetical protein DJ013_12205 [Arcticibacterium luteifluviistationis]
MIVCKGVRLPKISGIAIFPFIIVRSQVPSVTLLNHEKIHIRQQIELLVVFFYIWYVLEWFMHYLKVRNFWAAYRMISFEKESYCHENDLDYLKKRKFWAFLNHI